MAMPAHSRSEGAHPETYSGGQATQPVEADFCILRNEAALIPTNYVRWRTDLNLGVDALCGGVYFFDSIAWGKIMNLNVSLAPLVSLLAGILILVMPKLLNFIVAIYLIVIGLIGLFGAGALHLK